VAVPTTHRRKAVGGRQRKGIFNVKEENEAIHIITTKRLKNQQNKVDRPIPLPILYLKL
jgi:hypothetical protein